MLSTAADLQASQAGAWQVAPLRPAVGSKWGSSSTNRRLQISCLQGGAPSSCAGGPQGEVWSVIQQLGCSRQEAA